MPLATARHCYQDKDSAASANADGRRAPLCHARGGTCPGRSGHLLQRMLCASRQPRDPEADNVGPPAQAGTVILDAAVGGSSPDIVRQCASPNAQTSSGGTMTVRQLAVSVR
jgi:hypothetical protein